ncbi:MAG: T9SS type A sorting domain-containing protein, partial [Saprospiraceae bacterium]|nr:T9SS type A sorting domain-containing protein [Saprospiraceae bacterium]
SASTNLKIVAPESDDNGTEAYITIFDLNGSVRRTLQPMPVTNGIVQVTLELVDLPAGVYVVQVRLGQFIGRKQLVRMR